MLLHWVIPRIPGKCRNQFFFLQFFIFHDRQKTKIYPTLVHSLILSTNSKIHIFNYVPHKNKRNVYFVTYGKEQKSP